MHNERGAPAETVKDDDNVAINIPKPSSGSKEAIRVTSSPKYSFFKLFIRKNKDMPKVSSSTAVEDKSRHDKSLSLDVKRNTAALAAVRWPLFYSYLS